MGTRIDVGTVFAVLNYIIDLVFHVIIAKARGTDVFFERSLSSRPQLQVKFWRIVDAEDLFIPGC